MIFLTIFSSCGTQENVDPAEKILGKWQVYSFKADAEELPESVKDYATGLALTVTYEFNKDFTYEIISDEDPFGRKGTWSYDPGTKEYELKIEEEEPSRVKILRESDEVLIFESRIEDIGVVKIYLKKIGDGSRDAG